MRTTILLFAVALAGTASAQSPYRPFAPLGSTWTVASGGLHFGCNPLEALETTNTFVVGDLTTVNGVELNELWQATYGSWMAVGPPTGGPCPTSGLIGVPPFVAGLIREDVLARKVFLGPDSTDLLYDFSIGLGTYPLTVDNVLYPALQVVALDSMELNDGWHRTWVLGVDEGNGLHDSAFCTIIEGIGSTFGPLPFASLTPMFEFSDALTCFSLPEQATLPLGVVECGVTLGLVAPGALVDDLKMGPNPVDGTLWYEHPATITYMDVLDMRGNMVARQRIDGHRGVVDLHMLPPGVYGLRLSLEGGATLMKRFVKN